ncbi:hypothetical protein ASPBRDRAFT_412385 [Aspergillus brasiliensis CBS 101740]|uniref:Uncharacterized protein n=1 Tax=Aspergillus brasiliensis (strain CBS 101740 / IMI 381727 / IBT 21946) TaxID=767769 RepID=A0A1L9UXT6_ASPBC|nr:hypothetical protein ASPBRDRAFT_412385 [Aspergillus brasiliensis CBS 101740]
MLCCQSNGQHAVIASNSRVGGTPYQHTTVISSKDLKTQKGAPKEHTHTHTHTRNLPLSRGTQQRCMKFNLHLQETGLDWIVLASFRVV